MKKVVVPHSWSLTPRQAVAVQKQLSVLVRQITPPTELRLVAGLDAAFSADGRYCLAAVVLWDTHDQEVVEQHTARRRLSFPYIPGLLSFREAPALLTVLRQLKRVPDLLMCDGHGLAHPRRFGIACHLGVLCEMPAIGCAKSRLVGAHLEPAPLRGARVPLLDRDQVLGTVVRTQTNTKPVYVSVGHLIDLATAEKIVLDCAARYRLPEPTRLADRLVAAYKHARTTNRLARRRGMAQSRGV
jgi:deoxyribonuclease V